MAEENKNPDPKLEGDPAEFLLSNSEYHDCHLTVGNPETDDVENIGVARLDLIAHSSVFRDMLADSELADPSGSNTHIKDVSPATFKLMLRHVYGGKLPKMTHEEAADLALCADKYNIQRLVGKAAKRLKPTSAEDVFPAFMVVMYIKCPELELQVTEIIRQKTDKIVQNLNFLELDENCILFIVKQSMLNISELELWKSVVRWAENQVQKHPEKTLKCCLSKVLPFVRLLVLTVEEIAKYVLPTNILSQEEFVDLTLAVTNKQIIQIPGFCNCQEKRTIYTEEHILKPYLDYRNLRVELASEEHSTLTIESSYRSIEIVTFTFKSFSASNKNYSLVSDNIACDIEICTSSKGLVTTHETIKVKGRAVPNQTVTLPVKKNNGQPLILEVEKVYTLKISTSPPLPVHKFSSRRYNEEHDIPFPNSIDGNRVVATYEDPFHIMEIAYKFI